ncbi:MAG: Ppx/GppA phosphatase family protein [Rhizobiaceae bacterium]
MNTKGVSAVTGENPSQKRLKNRRNRWRKRKRKSENGVQADNASNAASAQQQSSEGAPQNTSEAVHEGALDKRRTRRPGRKQASPEPAVVTDQPQAERPKHHQQPHKGSGNKTPRPKVDAYAALDLGTNNCRLLVAVPQQPGRFKVIDAFSRIVRLGEGLGASGRLSDEAMDRAVEALKACAAKLDNRKVRGVRLIATEACRQASNGSAFLERVKQEAGLDLELISREAEAKLAVAGCASLVDREAKGVVLFDIGGGSSELALLELGKRKRHDLSDAIVSWTSLPLGVVTLSEKYGGGKKVTRAVFEAMVAEVDALLANFEGKDALAAAAEQGEIHLLGTSGTVTTLAGIHLKLPRYDRRQVDGVWMASKEVDAMIEALVDMSFEERVKNPCIGHDRADLVLAGCAILIAIQKQWPCPRLRVADRGLREGLLTEMMNADKVWQRRNKHNRHRRSKQRKNNEVKK